MVFGCAAGAGMMLSEGTKPGQLALAVYCQLEADIDDALAAQAVKCLVHLSKDMLAADRTAGLVSTTLAADAEQISASNEQHHVQNLDSHQHRLQHQANGNAQLASAEKQASAEGADSEDQEEEADEPNGHQAGLAGAPSLTLQGLVRRMTKMAGDRSVWRSHAAITSHCHNADNTRMICAGFDKFVTMLEGLLAFLSRGLALHMSARSLAWSKPAA